MKKNLFKVSLILMAIVIFNACNESLVDEQGIDEQELKSASNSKKSYIVVLQDAQLDSDLSVLKGYERKQEIMKSVSARILSRAGITDGEVQHVYGTALKGFSVMIPPGQLKKLQDDPSVKYIEEDQVIALINPINKTSGNIVVSGETIPWGITRVNGGNSTYNGSGIVWIIDTGVDLTHPDLNVDDSRGASFVRNVTSPDDDNGHGSHVAGTIAAKKNNNGVVGIAPGATVIPVKVLDRRGSGWNSWVIAGVDFVAENASDNDVANMSLGGGASTSLDNSVFNASESCRFALAAGNESDNANNHSPARVNNPGRIFTVSAMGEGDVWASFSNYGNPPVDYCEPGVSVLSCYKDGLYATGSGTSMASPHMAGILLLSGNSIATDGIVTGDPDGNADSIAVVGTNNGGGGTTNNPPVANAGSDITVTDYNGDGEVITLNGSASTDDHGIISYTWTENGSTIATGVSASVNFAVGTHTVTLTVSDGEYTDTDIVIVNVNSGSTSDVAPVINSFVLTNTSNPALKRAQISWNVTDDNGDLQTVTSKLMDPNGKSVITSTAVTGSSASGIHELSFKKGASGAYTVTTVVTDQQGNSDTRTENIDL